MLDPQIGVGPGVSFGQTMEKYTGIPQGLLACAHGGSTMEQWDPRKKRLGLHSLYGATLHRVRRNGGRIAGIVWYQGCSDAILQVAPYYTRRMKSLVTAFRRDLGNPRLPFVLAQLAPVAHGHELQEPFWNSIRDQQRRLPKEVDRCLCVPTIDLEMEDCIHIDAASQHRLGRRLAEAMCVLTKAGKSFPAPIEFDGYRLSQGKGFPPRTSIEVKFSHVAGSLRAGSKPTGFALSDWRGQRRDVIFKTLLQGNRVILRTALSENDLKGLRLHYGFGLNPIANITDARDRSLPAFGPIPFGPPTSPFVHALRVSQVCPSAGTLENLSCPDPADPNLGWQARIFPEDFCNRRDELFAHAPNDVVVHYACRFRCAVAMDLLVDLGYDGPVKVWLDKQPIFHDPTGTNPALPGDARIPISPGAGEHELIVSLGSNHGNAWGIFLRFQSRKAVRRLSLVDDSSRFLPHVMG